MNTEQLFAHFDRVSEAPDAIPRLRRFILDLAVRGKLVKQDRADEPVSELLMRIQAEKALLMKAGEIRKSKPLPLIDPDSLPVRIPKSWEWVSIRTITSDRGQKVPDKEFSYVDVSAIDNLRGRITEPQVLSPDAAPSRARKVVLKGDLIYSCVRPYLLNIAIIEEEYDRTLRDNPFPGRNIL
jgi:type I restriction enzyme S subunit